MPTVSDIITVASDWVTSRMHSWQSLPGMSYSHKLGSESLGGEGIPVPVIRNARRLPFWCRSFRHPGSTAP